MITLDRKAQLQKEYMYFEGLTDLLVATIRDAIIPMGAIPICGKD
jgi:hypothetical protein